MGASLACVRTPSARETFRGGVLFIFRWLIHYPIVFGTYRLKGWSRAPFLLQPELYDGERPGILVSNYGNYFFDGILSLMLGPVWPYFFVREKFYRMPVLGRVLKFFRAIPILRTRDLQYSAEQRARVNERTFRWLSSRLQEGQWLATFPEADPSELPVITKPLRPGAAHIGLRAEAESGWKLGLNIYVYGTNYENRVSCRSNVFIRWAKPIRVADFRDLYERNTTEAEVALMGAIEAAMAETVFQAPSIELLEDAHRLATQRSAANPSGVQQALVEVLSGEKSPREIHQNICRRGQDSVFYQCVGFLLLFTGWILGWPFRAFGKICARNRSQEMTYQAGFWLSVFVVGALAGGGDWVLLQLALTWIGSKAWLWAWRRGIVDTTFDRMLTRGASIFGL